MQAIHESVPDMKEIAEKTNMRTQARSTRTVGPEIATHTDILDTSQVRTALGGTALGGTALGGTALGGTAIGGTPEQMRWSICAIKLTPSIPRM